MRSPFKSKFNYAAATLVAIACGAAIGLATGSRTQHVTEAARPPILEGDGVRGPRGMLWISGGEFVMGSDHRLARPNEQPAHKVRVHGFWMDRSPVTNAQFTAFVAATGYVTTAEKAPDWEH